MKWGVGIKKGKYRVIEERNNGQDGYTVFGPRGKRAWYGRDTVWIKTKDDALALHISHEPNAWGQLKSLLDESLGYLLAVGWRTLALWLVLTAALYSWEPHSAETPLHYFYLQSYIAEGARKQILWLIALALAQVWIGMNHVKLKDNRHTLFIITAICAFMSIYGVQHSASELIKAAYGSPSYKGDLDSAHSALSIGVGLLLLGPWFIWRKRDDLPT
jgi:hypothetical protein